MKITICSSMTFLDRILVVKKQLEELGHEVLIPEMSEGFDYHTATVEQRIQRKRQFDLIRRHWEKIRQGEAILVLNYEKDGIPNYVGGNSFLEMGFAHVLSKPIYLLNPIPDLPYRSEMAAMDPVVLNGEFARIPVAERNSMARHG
jgi:hypothetical protein